MTESAGNRFTFTFSFFLFPVSQMTKDDSIDIRYFLQYLSLFSEAGSHLTIWFISKIGSRIEITINPTITAINRIIIGSRRAVMPVMRVSTSRS